jgi:hypothetical protein
LLAEGKIPLGVGENTRIRYLSCKSLCLLEWISGTTLSLFWFCFRCIMQSALLILRIFEAQYVSNILLKNHDMRMSWSLQFTFHFWISSGTMSVFRIQCCWSTQGWEFVWD